MVRHYRALSVGRDVGVAMVQDTMNLTRIDIAALPNEVLVVMEDTEDNRRTADRICNLNRGSGKNFTFAWLSSAEEAA